MSKWRNLCACVCVYSACVFECVREKIPQTLPQSASHTLSLPHARTCMLKKLTRNRPPNPPHTHAPALLHTLSRSHANVPGYWRRIPERRPLNPKTQKPDTYKPKLSYTHTLAHAQTYLDTEEEFPRENLWTLNTSHLQTQSVSHTHFLSRAYLDTDRAWPRGQLTKHLTLSPTRTLSHTDTPCHEQSLVLSLTHSLSRTVTRTLFHTHTLCHERI